MSEQTQIGRELRRKFSIFDIDILHENYSCTIDFGREMHQNYKEQLQRHGFNVTHEEGTIYTLEYGYQA